jgi:TolA-binding protein
VAGETVSEQGASQLRDDVARENRATARSFSRGLSGVAMIAAMVGVAGSSKLFFDDQSIGEILDGRASSQVTVLNERSVDEIRILSSQVAALKKAQAEIVRLPAADRVQIQNTAIVERMAEVERRQQRLEQAILNSPEKALTMPLMRRDIENMREANAQSVSAIKQNVDQIYDLTKWLLGALTVGVMSLALVNFLTKK